MNADQGDGWEGDAGMLASDPPVPSQKYAELGSKPLAIHDSTIKCRIVPTGIYRQVTHIVENLMLSTEKINASRKTVDFKA